VSVQGSGFNLSGPPAPRDRRSASLGRSFSSVRPESLAPVGRLEEEQAEFIASILWRRRRVIRYESGVINHQYHRAPAEEMVAGLYGAEDKSAIAEPHPGLVLIRQQRAVIPKDDALDNITRYEAHLHRLLIQNLHEYEALQARRRGEKTNLGRVSIVGPPRGTPRVKAATSQPAIPDFLQRATARLDQLGA
jgi:hypothetical protein